MVLVDTSVWIDFFIGAPSTQADALESLITERANVCVCGLIITEILQGIKSDKSFHQTMDLLETTVFLPMTRDTYVHAATLYRGLRKKGFTIRKPIGCMIAATALEHDIPLLHKDKDFHPLQNHCALKTHHDSI